MACRLMGCQNFVHEPLPTSARGQAVYNFSVRHEPSHLDLILIADWSSLLLRARELPLGDDQRLRGLLIVFFVFFLSGF